jgi:hypothetical protein
MSFREDVNELAGAIDKSNKFQRKTAGWSSKVMEASGLTAMTQRAKNVITGELHGNVAAHRTLDWDSLPSEFRDSAASVGIRKKDWDAIRATKAYEPTEGKGAQYIRPEDVAEINPDAAFKYEQWTQKMRKLVTNEPQLSTKAITTGAFLGPAAPGDPARFAASWLFMFKSFPLSVVFNYVIPTYQRGVMDRKWGQFGGMVFSATVLGAAAIQAKDTLKGREPREMDNARFWAAAFVQGGGAGMFGDFLFADQNRFGMSPLKSMLGPGYQLAEDVMAANLGPAWGLAFDDAMEFEDAFEDWRVKNTKILQRLVPGSSLWPTRLAYDRLLVDNINDFVDPEYRSKIARHKRQLRKDFGQKYYDFAEPR